MALGNIQAPCSNYLIGHAWGNIPDMTLSGDNSPLFTLEPSGTVNLEGIHEGHELSLAQAGFFETKHSSQIRNSVVM